MIDRIKNAFTESIQIKIESADTLPNAVAKAGDLMVKSLIEGGKILTCGNGGSAGNAQQFASVMLNRLERERPSLPAIALTSDSQTLSAIANDSDFHDVFSKQIRALGNEGDVLLVFSSNGNAPSAIKAMEAALNRDMLIVAVTGVDGGSIAGLIGSNDVEIRVPANSYPRIQEVHLLVAHTLCDYIDNSLFGEQG
ncbi:SIS domain-containing protein [Pleionea mediterranea]|jgi:phosphoheptose isomerase|uniref:D-sedoheptulose 7-phosphate isomerase/DnaA initiator-associating protein n=1 Tax=Pleionea mediterranea TaxID=523701 RepID=A0A316FGB8_9GAMM|nr:SIS domain-containing protein [Pleionea mediterranea]PWK47948.1 D-sedoheptulose 7-phosphate isomerase/DnaA initiator-associating protein [Pleionea mediterranea]